MAHNRLRIGWTRPWGSRLVGRIGRLVPVSVEIGRHLAGALAELDEDPRLPSRECRQRSGTDLDARRHANWPLVRSFQHRSGKIWPGQVRRGRSLVLAVGSQRYQC